MLKARDLLVKTRTKMINSVRGMAKAMGIRLPCCATDGFAKRVSALLPDVLKASLGPILTTIQALTDQIGSFDKLILGMVKTKYPETERLMQVHGVGPITAMEYVLTIEDPGRFAKSRQVASFIGLQPKQRQSGDRSPQLGISKQGNSHLRRLLVQCAHHILGCWGTLIATCDVGAQRSPLEAVPMAESELLSQWLGSLPSCYISCGFQVKFITRIATP
jgi:transposase